MPNSTSAVTVAPEYLELKAYDDSLDMILCGVKDAEDEYEAVLEDFADACHKLWVKERAQGSRKDKGFRKALKQAGVKVGRAYRAMAKFYSADFPKTSKPRSQRTKSVTTETKQVDLSTIKAMLGKHLDRFSGEKQLEIINDMSEWLLGAAQNAEEANMHKSLITQSSSL